MAISPQAYQLADKCADSRLGRLGPFTVLYVRCAWEEADLPLSFGPEKLLDCVPPWSRTLLVIEQDWTAVSHTIDAVWVDVAKVDAATWHLRIASVVSGTATSPYNDDDTTDVASWTPARVAHFKESCATRSSSHAVGMVLSGAPASVCLGNVVDEYSGPPLTDAIQFGHVVDLEYGSMKMPGRVWDLLSAPQSEKQHHYELILYFAWRVLRCFTVANCRNVTTPEVQAPRGIRRARVRAGLPSFREHVIQLPSQRGVDGATTGTGQSTALHLVRGHFKHYGPERPLFGHVVGTYWWGQQVRGSAERGAVHKRYELETA